MMLYSDCALSGHPKRLTPNIRFFSKAFVSSPDVAVSGQAIIQCEYQPSRWTTKAKQSIPNPISACALIAGLLTAHCPGPDEVPKTIVVIIPRGTLTSKQRWYIKENCGGTTVSHRSPHRGAPRELRVVGPSCHVDEAYKTALHFIEENPSQPKWAFCSPNQSPTKPTH
jgi:hypothetical protein